LVSYHGSGFPLLFVFVCFKNQCKWYLYYTWYNFSIWRCFIAWLWRDTSKYCITIHSNPILSFAKYVSHMVITYYLSIWLFWLSFFFTLTSLLNVIIWKKFFSTTGYFYVVFSILQSFNFYFFNFNLSTINYESDGFHSLIMIMMSFFPR